MATPLPIRPSTARPPSWIPSSVESWKDPAMSWHDTSYALPSSPFSCSPLGNMMMSMSPPLSLSPGAYLGQMASVEQELCRNYTCCGMAIADLHELVSHYEENHVIVVSADGTRLSSSPPSSSSNPATPPLSIPAPPPHAFLSSRSPNQSAFVTASVLTSPAPSAAPSVPPPTPSYISPLLSVPAPNAPKAYEDEPEFSMDMDDVQQPPVTPKPQAPPCLPLYVLAPTPSVAGTAGPKKMGRPPTKKDGQPRRDREKTYKCPHPGCRKSYLNPGGLKYHLAKGTCDSAER